MFFENDFICFWKICYVFEVLVTILVVFLEVILFVCVFFLNNFICLVLYPHFIRFSI